MRKHSMKKIYFIIFALFFVFYHPVYAPCFEWIKITTSTRSDLHGLWGSAPDNIYAVGGDSTTILHFDGARWQDLEVRLPKAAQADTFALWGSSAEDIYAVGGWISNGIHKGSILHFDGSSWTSMTEPGNSLRSWVNVLYGIWGTASTDIYAVGERNYSLRMRSWIGPVVHFDGTQWSEVKNPRENTTGSELFHLWGSSPSNIFAVGTPLRSACEESRTRCIMAGLMCWEECTRRVTYNFANILHYNGSQWEHIETGINKTLHSIWGSASGTVFAVGDSGTILQYTGETWTPMQSGTQEHLRSIWGFSDTDVYVAGTNGVLLHFNGSQWTRLETPVGNSLNALWGFSSDRVYAAGDNGTLLVYAHLFDYPDAPDPPYASFFSRNGARHAFTDFIWLGEGVATEHDAFADTSDSFDDGVEFLGSSPVSGGPYTLPYKAGQFGALSIQTSGGPAENCYLHGWIDWNIDGDWDDEGETIFCSVPISVPGTYTLEFPIPSDASSSCTWARFRLDWKDNFCSPTGSATYGEVEDYEVCPTLIRLASFTALPGDKKVVLTWSTESEINNAGFNLYRSEKPSDGYVRINTSLITAQGAADHGAWYTFTDTGLINGVGYSYILEDIDTSGTSSRHGPVSAVPTEQPLPCNPFEYIYITAEAPVCTDNMTTGTVMCSSHAVFSNTGSTDVQLFWKTAYAQPRKTIWYQATIPAGTQVRSSEPAWGYLRPTYGPVQPWSTSIVTGCCSQVPDGEDQCAALKNDIKDNELNGQYPVQDITNLNPCK